MRLKVDETFFGFYSAEADRLCGHALYEVKCAGAPTTIEKVTFVSSSNTITRDRISARALKAARAAGIPQYLWPDARLVGKLGRMIGLVWSAR
jgi:hypothetical protein